MVVLVLFLVMLVLIFGLVENCLLFKRSEWCVGWWYFYFCLYLSKFVLGKVLSFYMGVESFVLISGW